MVTVVSKAVGRPCFASCWVIWAEPEQRLTFAAACGLADHPVTLSVSDTLPRRLVRWLTLGLWDLS